VKTVEGGRSHVGLFAEACFIWLERLPVAQEVAHGGSFTCFIRKTYRDTSNQNSRQEVLYKILRDLLRIYPDNVSGAVASTIDADSLVTQQH
jgi:hypothetical protein